MAIAAGLEYSSEPRELNGSESFAHQNPRNLMAFHVLHNWIVMGTPPLAYTVQQQTMLEECGEGT